MVRGTYLPWPVAVQHRHRQSALLFVFLSSHSNHFNVPVSEKKVLKPVSGSAFLRSSVKYPSGCYHKGSVSHVKFPSVIQGGGTPATTPTYLNAVLETVEL